MFHDLYEYFQGVFSMTKLPILKWFHLGVIETLYILETFPHHETSQKSFFQTMKQIGHQLNMFYRVKGSMEHADLIKYKLDTENQKIIYLTPKAEQVLTIMHQIDALFLQSSENKATDNWD